MLRAIEVEKTWHSVTNDISNQVIKKLKTLPAHYILVYYIYTQCQQISDPW